jgi:tetratricopeptide (TPR) repeat protein/predicted Ser/Thr protein kinase
VLNCPSNDDLQRFLLGEPSLEIGPHIRACSTCQTVVERLSDDGTLAGWPGSLAAHSLTDEQDREPARLVSALRELHLETRVWSREGPSFNMQADARLEPPDSPDDLGRMGEFAVESEIGRGGMGIVYRARDRATGRIVALKILHGSSANDRNRRRFIQEVRAAASVEHDNVVRLYSTYDPPDGQPYFVMEYVAGPTLADELRIRRRLEPREAAKRIAEAADGLAAAHAAGLVHRDVKPSNILIDAATGRAKIGDFGLARISSEVSELTRDGEVAGTPAYLSPEQASGDPEAGVGADVYALGVTLYECLAGEPPFRGAHHRVIKQILNDEPRPPRELNDAVSRDLETVCLKAMAKNPGHRYLSARELADDLRRWINGEPIRARAIGPLGRFGRLCGRHPKVAILTSSLVATLLAGVVGVFWQWRKAEANARQAREYLHRTLASVDVFFTKVSENSLLDVPSLQPLRKELLEEARTAYESLLRERPNDLLIRAELARASARLARVVYAIESSDKGIALLRQAINELDRVLNESPADLAARYDLIECLALTAKSLVNSSRFDEGRALYQRVLTECAEVRRRRGDSIEAQTGVESAYAGLGRISLHSGRIAEAVADLERSLHEDRELLKRKPGEPRFLQNLTNTSIDLSDAYKAQGRHDKAKSIFEEGFQAAKRLIAEHPRSLEYRSRLAAYFISRAGSYLNDSITVQGESALAALDEALRTCAEGVALQRELVRANPTVDTYRPDLMELLMLDGGINYLAGKHEAAIASMNEALAVHSVLAKGGLRYAASRLHYVNTLVALSNVLCDVGRFAEGLQKLSDAESELSAITKEEQEMVGSIDFHLYVCKITRAIMLMEAGRPAESTASFDEAVRIAPHGIRPIAELSRDVARAESSLGPSPTPARALALAPVVEVICRSTPLSACGNITFAKILALAAQAAPDSVAKESLETSAVLRIQKASETGYLRSARNRQRLVAVPVFESLRRRAEFASILAGASARNADR